jgi:hypothetical protein
MEEQSKIKTENQEEKEVTIISEQERENSEDINLFFQKTVKNTISAFFLSLISTIINFTCNIPLLRTVSKESYGVVKVYFELAFTLVNFIPRETMRRTSQKFCADKDSKKENEKYIIISQINYLFVIFTSILSIVIFLAFVLFTDSQKLHENLFQLIIYIVCALVELIVEPVMMYMNLHVENKFLPITISSLSRVISNTIFIAFYDMDLWAFTLSRIVGTTVYIIYIFGLGIFKYKLNFLEFIPKDIKSLIFEKTAANGTNLLYLREILVQFIKLNLINLILSRCQNLILSFVIKSSEEEKSDYSFVSQNYSLISRFLFEPIIDAFYNLVNKIKYIENKRIEVTNVEKDINENDDTDLMKEEMEEKDKKDPKVEESVENNKNHINKKEINYDLSLKLLKLFIKIFNYVAVLIIPYYILIGTEVMGLIYGSKWETNSIDKIGDCYSYFVIIVAISDLIKNFGNATNDTHQMNLSYISLIANAIFLSVFMYIISMWDICGIIVTNVLSALFLINFNLYIIFCGKKEKIKINNIKESSIYSEISNFISKCFISANSIIATLISIIIGYFTKNVIFGNSSSLVKLIMICIIGGINVFFLYKFEYQRFVNDLNIIKSY